MKGQPLRGSCNWLDSRCVEKIRKRNTFLPPLSYLFVSFNGLCSHAPEAFSMRNNVEHSQLRWGSWNWPDSRCVETTRKHSKFLRAPLAILFTPFNGLCIYVSEACSMWNNVLVCMGGGNRGSNRRCLIWSLGSACVSSNTFWWTYSSILLLSCNELYICVLGEKDTSTIGAMPQCVNILGFRPLCLS